MKKLRKGEGALRIVYSDAGCFSQSMGDDRENINRMSLCRKKNMCGPYENMASHPDDSNEPRISYLGTLSH